MRLRPFDWLLGGVFFLSGASALFALPATISVGTLKGNSRYEIEFSNDASFDKILSKSSIKGNSYTWEAPAEGAYHWRLVELEGIVRTPSAKGSFVCLQAGTDRARISWSRTGSESRYKIRMTTPTGKVTNIMASGYVFFTPRQSTPLVVEIIPDGPKQPEGGYYFQPALALNSATPESRTPVVVPVPKSVEPDGSLVETNATGPTLKEQKAAKKLGLSADNESAPQKTQLTAQPTGDLVEINPGSHTQEQKLPPSQEPPPTKEIPGGHTKEYGKTPDMTIKDDQNPAQPPPPQQAAPAAVQQEKKPAEPSPVAVKEERRHYLVQLFGTYDQETIRSQKLEIDLNSKKGSAGIGGMVWVNPVAGLVLSGWGDFHQHSAKLRQEAVFGESQISFSKPRYTLEGALGWNLLSFFGVSNHVLELKAAGAFAEVPTLPLQFEGGPDVTPTFSNTQFPLVGGSVGYSFLSGKVWGISAEASYFVSTNASKKGDMGVEKFWFEYSPVDYLSLSAGAFARTTAIKMCHSDQETCLVEGKVHTNTSEYGGLLGIGVVVF